MSGRVTFPRVLHSEWVKLVTLRSTYWTVGATVVVMVLIALLLGAASQVETTTGAPGPDGEMAIGLGYSFAQVVVAVLGTLMVTGEYATGMIRSTLVAVPRRLPALAAKALLITAVGFLLGVVGVALSYLVSLPLLGAAAADLGDPEVQRIFWGTGLYLAGVGLFGLGVGALLRHTAGAITVTLGVLLMLGTVMQLLMLASDVFMDLYPYLPTTAGERIVTPAGDVVPGDGPGMLGPWEGYAVFMAYVTAALASAAALLVRRDA
jgi:ABC-2 type transport system permease protein